MRYMQTSELLTARQVADRLGVSVFTVASWARSGKLRTAVQGPGVRGARLFDRSDVERFATERGAT